MAQDTPPSPPPLDSPYEDPEIVDPEVRTAKAVLFLLAFVPLAILVVVLLVFFQPDHQVVMTRYPSNGYPKTRAEYIVGPGDRPIREGRYQAWYETGELSEEGQYLADQRSGEWRFWDAGGVLDAQRSGVYEADQRVRGLDP